VYREGITLDGEYNNGVATAGGMTINYTIELIKDEQSGEVINKMMYFEYEGDMIFLTTQELDGLDTESYNNKHYVANHYSYQDYYFQEGFYVSSIGSLAEYNYFVYQNWIWSYDQIIKGVEGIYKDVSMEAKINPDGTFTRFEDGREIIYTYKGQTFEKN